MNRRTFLKTAFGSGIFGSIVATTASCASQIAPSQLSIEQIDIPIRNLPADVDGFHIVAMSDFHISPNEDLEIVQHAVDITNDLQPNLVLFVGDYVERGVEGIHDLAPTLARIQSDYGLYASFGNHEYADGDASVIHHALQDEGITVLRNAGTVIGDDLFYLAGMDDAWFELDNLDDTLSRQPAQMPTVLMMHEPDVADTVAPTNRVDLMVSGHSHGGQIRLPFYGAPILPRLGQKYEMGLYQVDKMWLYTTRGIGTNSLPMRFNCPPEVTQITLRQA